MIAPYVTTLTPDPSDTDRSITLSPAEQADELIAHWCSLSPRDAARYWRDASDDEREVIRQAEHDAHAVVMATLNAYRTKHSVKSAA